MVMGPLAEPPSAHTLLLATATTPCRSLSPPGGFGLETTLHVEPSQCSVSVATTSPGDAQFNPTVQISSGATPATDHSSLSNNPTFGLDTTLHLEPFQCSISVRPP